MSNKDKIFELADSQQGFFTAKQAEQCGFTRSNFHLKLSSGEWTQEGRGIYRLARYPVTDRPELVLWSLWSRNLQDAPQGVWSHETALDIHELSDVMPAKMHMTVPQGFRRRIETPQVLCLHYANLEQSEIEGRQGCRVTTPFRTLLDVFEAETVADNFLSQALHQALERGLVTEEELLSLKNTNSNVYLKMKSLSNDKF